MAKTDEQRVDAGQPRTASKSVKLQRPDSGHRVQSLRKGHGRLHPASFKISKERGAKNRGKYVQESL